MPGFKDSNSNSQNLVFANNADFSGLSPVAESNGLNTDGQIWLGQTSPPMGHSNIQVMTLTQGTGITIAYDFTAKTATFSAAGMSFAWNDVTTATQLITVENGYVTDRGGGVTYTLPATAAFGDSFIITGKSGLWTLAQNANQQVLLGSTGTTSGVGGSIVATSAGDTIECVCTTGGASTIWRVISVIGNPTIN